MASFVSEVLATAGELQKEEVTTKLGQLSKRISQLKVDVNEVLTSKYEDFKPTLSDAFELNSQVTTLSDEMKTVTEKIETEVRNKLNVSSSEFSDLRTQLSETNGVLDILECLVNIHDALQAAQSALKLQEFPVVANNLQTVHNALEKLAKAPRSCELKILQALHSEYRVMSERLIYDLSETWSERIVWNTTAGTLDSAGDGKKVTQLKIKTNDKKLLISVVEGMEMVETLDSKLKNFGDKLMSMFIKPVISTNAKITVLGSSLKIAHRKEEIASPSDAFTELDTLFLSLNKFLLGINLKQADGTAMARFGSVMSQSFLDFIIKECLAPSVPTSHKELDKYNDVVSVTDKFNKVLVKCKFLSEDNMQMLDYVKNINVLFANKKCQEILEKARKLMKSEIHNMVQIGDTKIDEKEPMESDAKKAETAANEVKTNRLMSFRLPTCHISISVKTLVDIAYETLTEANISSPQCAVQLFYCVRNMFELFCCVVPTYHKDSLASLPQLTALHHNNCMYIAHHLMTLGHQFAPKLRDPLMQAAPTFVDLVPKFRRLGTEIFLQQMQTQKKLLLEFLGGAEGFDTVSEDDHYNCCERALKQILHQLLHLSKVWNDVLPENIYYKSIGTLLGSVLQEMTTNITNLDDISADDATQLHALMTMLHDRAPELLILNNDEKSSSLMLLHSHVPKWVRFTEIMMVLNASLQDICDRWADGKGPLAEEFTPNEVKQLIRALFQNTDRRSAVLAKIK